MQFYSLLDLVILPIYLAIILLLANIHAKKMIEKDPIYKYYLPGLMVKILGGLGLAFVYTFYYPGGDTIQYFWDSLSFQKLMFVDFGSFWHVLLNKAEVANYYYFTSETGYPAYCRDPKAWFVVKIALFLVGLGFQSYLSTTVLCATLSFFGVWKLYKLFSKEFPGMNKELATAFLFIPSVFFWGSGLLKDTFTICALGFFIHGIYYSLISRSKIVVGIITSLIAGYFIISIKPYILVGLMPAIIIWIIHRLISSIKSVVLKSASVPIMILFGLIIGYGFMTILGTALQEYKLDSILEKAVVNQRDLKSDYHNGNSFDIGEFDADSYSVLSKLPIAIFSAIFRPFITEANNLVMFISSIENLVILIFTIRVFFLTGIFGFFRIAFKNNSLTFLLVFSLLFAFSVGLSTSNFGSLVRYKIPCIPFFIATLFVVRHKRRIEIEEDQKNKVQLPNYGDIQLANSRSL
jgi:hypothetical protein